MSKATDMQNQLTGWGALDLNNPAYGLMREEQTEQIKQINADMRELFMDSEQGQRVLQILMGWTIKKPTANPNESTNMAFFREGQNDIVRCILMACNNSELGDKQNG